MNTISYFYCYLEVFYDIYGYPETCRDLFKSVFTLIYFETTISQKLGEEDIKIMKDKRC